MSSSEGVLLAARDLVKRYDAPATAFARRRTVVQAVDGVSLDVRAGEALGIVGESGCGKSTTARMLAWLTEPTSGSVAYRGRDLATLRGAELRRVRREIQVVFQDPYASLNPRRTVEAIIAEPLVIHGVEPGRARRRARVRELLELVGLDASDAQRHPYELSGGMRQRVGIARAVALGPRLLIADEPVSALDVSVQAQILNLLARLRSELRLTLVLISHDLAVVRHLCDRVAVMYLGRVVETAPADALFEHPRHPYTRALLDAVPVADPSHRAAGVALRGELPDAAAPPSGCRFHPRCPRAQVGTCDVLDPVLAQPPGGGMVACHFPLDAGEPLAAAAGARSQSSSSA